MKQKSTSYCYLCNKSNFNVLKVINEKPIYETDFSIRKKDYRRTIKLCMDCGVYLNHHSYDLERIYTSSYNQKKYSNKISDHFERIMALPFQKSDNKQRVSRIKNFYRSKRAKLKNLEILDIGSGLCVFLALLKNENAILSCIDPSIESIKHAKNRVGVNYAVHGDIFELEFDKKYDFISLNKVIEHVKNPLDLLLKSKKLLQQDGFIYFEVPDGENAAKNGGYVNREEFYIEHYTIFSDKSIRFLIDRVGLKLNKISRIHEPSDKYTFCCFVSKIEN